MYVEIGTFFLMEFWHGFCFNFFFFTFSWYIVSSKCIFPLCDPVLTYNLHEKIKFFPKYKVVQLPVTSKTLLGLIPPWELEIHSQSQMTCLEPPKSYGSAKIGFCWSKWRIPYQRLCFWWKIKFLSPYYHILSSEEPIPCQKEPWKNSQSDISP